MSRFLQFTVYIIDSIFKYWK